MMMVKMCAAQAQKSGKPSFEPVHAVHVVDPVYPHLSVASGIVILKVAVSQSGEVDGIEVIHPIPSLTEQAEQAVKEWKFEPAKVSGEPVKSSIVVSIGFSNLFTRGAPWVAEPQPDKPSGFEPIQILSAVEAPCPSMTVAAVVFPKTVILQMAVSESGAAEHIDVIHNVPPLTEWAEQTIQQWKFQPATINKRPVSSVMIASFTFRRPPDIAPTPPM